MEKNTIRSKLLGLFQLIRIELPFFAGICVILGEVLALGKLPGHIELISGFLSVFFISASAMVLNDYFDIESDKINAPHRPLPKGKVTRHEALLLFVVLSILGFVGIILIKCQLILPVLVVWVIGILYNWRFKRFGFVGNLMVAFSVAMTFMLGAMIVGKPKEIIVLLFSVLAGLFDLAEEIVGDALDVEGDQRQGSKSLAIKFGPDKAIRIAVGVFMLVLLVSIFLFILKLLDPIYAIPIIIMDISIIFSSIKLLRSKVHQKRKYLRYNYIIAGITLVIIFMIRLFMGV